MEKKLFSELGLSPELLKAIARIGFEQASPIQTAAIPVILGGADVVGQSQTGSGKTAAFAIPAIERTNPSLKAVQTLILCPTRELAVQVAEEVSKLSLFKRGIRELPVYGGQSYERQFRGLESGAQIVIGTPGRIMDHLERGTLRLDQLQTVILDEADRMLDMGFIEDIEHILQQAPANRQTVLFSATLPVPIQNLIRSFTRNPVNIRIAAETLTVPAIDQTYYEVDRRSKVEVLCRLIDLHDIRYAIIFCATKMMVDEVVEHLQARGYSADKLHGDIAQSARERVVSKFRKRSFEFLVATDVAARGLDIDDIEVVFNYDLPHDGEDYVHRIGRTGRAGRAGRAITFVAGREIYKLQNIQRFTKSRIRREQVPSADAVEEKRSQLFYDKLRSTLEAGDYRRHEASVDLLLEAGFSPTEIASALIHLATQDTQRAQEPAPLPNKTRPESRLSGSSPDSNGQENRPSSAPPPAKAARSTVPFRKQDKPGPILHSEEENAPSHAASHKLKHPRLGSDSIEKKIPGSQDSRKEFRPLRREQGMRRLRFNVGRQDEISPGDLVGVIAGVTRIPKELIGAIRLQDRSSFVDVSEDVFALVLKKLNKIKFKGHQLQVRPFESEG